MSKINRFDGDVPLFAQDATENYLFNFGDDSKDSWDGELSTMMNDSFKTGWETVSPSSFPPKQWFNSAMRAMSQSTAYLYQMGIPEYNAEQQYFVGSKCQLDGVTYTSLTDDNVGNDPKSSTSSWASETSSLQMAPYSQTRTYKQNETCTTFDPDTGELQIWTSYAPSDNVGHNPQDPANRHDDWPNFPTPCWWIKSHAVEPGTPAYWFSDDIPENALQVMDMDIDAGFYHRIAKAYPSLVADGKINLAQILGRYIRIADGSDYVVNTTHEDSIRSHAHEIKVGWNTDADRNTLGTLVNDFIALKAGTSTTQSGDNTRMSSVGGDQTAPQSTMANLIVFM